MLRSVDDRASSSALMPSRRRASVMNSTAVLLKSVLPLTAIYASQCCRVGNGVAEYIGRLRQRTAWHALAIGDAADVQLLVARVPAIGTDTQARPLAADFRDV